MDIRHDSWQGNAWLVPVVWPSHIAYMNIPLQLGGWSHVFAWLLFHLMSRLIKPSQSQGRLLPHQYLYGILCSWKSLLHDMTVTESKQLHYCTCSLSYTHTWPFHPGTKVLGVQGMWLVTTFLTGGGELGAQGSVGLYIISIWELSVLEHTPYTSMFSGIEHCMTDRLFLSSTMFTWRWIILHGGQSC